MAEIVPFKSVHYNGDHAGQLNRLITPPYDVISRKEQEGFYQAHPLNIIRVVLGKQFLTDSVVDNRYTRAATTLREWLEQGVLVRASRAGMTVYQMEFDDPHGEHRIIDGLVALVKVDDYGPGKVLPHEKTYKGPKEDQLKLIHACHANITPIHGLFSDPEQAVYNAYKGFMGAKPEQETRDAQGTIHRTWTLDDEAVIARIRATVADRSIFIADGHHRYETSLAFRNEMRAAEGTDLGTWPDYVMMYLTAMSHPGLTILAAHRLITELGDVDIDPVLRRLRPFFDIDELPFSMENRQAAEEELVKQVAALSQKSGNFGVAVRGEPCFRLLRLKNFQSVDRLIDPSVPLSLRDLDVTILREVVMGVGFGIETQNAEGIIEYTPSATDALERVERGEIQVSFVLNPTRVEQVQAAAELGHKLPHKSTYFYPKLSSGLVLNVFAP
ncbi:MAG: DUF1015 domain-containing protein [Thermodesulfobacteriota bacterium]